MTKILVVEDRAELSQPILDLLQIEGYETLSAVSGEAALELVQREPLELILCKQKLQDMKGFEFLERLRGAPRGGAVPFIFLTTKAERSWHIEALHLGADDCLVAPFSADELLKTVAARIRRHTAVVAQAQTQLDGIKQQFARMMTHELRTPLISINTVVDILSRQLTQLSTNELYDMLGTISMGSKRLSHRVEQLAFMTQLETGMLDHRMILESGMAMRLWELLMAAANLARRFAYQHQPNISLRMHERDPHAEVVCNPPALKQAMAEIISNAFKFAPADSDVHVTQWIADDFVWVSVTDSGPGIPEDQLATALSTFEQIGREANEQQGMGIGLALAQRIVQVHGGSLAIRSVVGKGTQVTVGLPLASVYAPQAASASSALR